MANPPDVLAYDEHHRQGNPVINWLKDLFWTWGPPLAVVFVVRSAIAEPFRIPSGSMVPTLEIGDHIIVSKFSYGLRVPFTDIEVMPLGEPERGDIIVFKYPPDPKLDYIKRVIGIPGDTVEVRDNVIFLNGVEAQRQLQETFTFVDDSCREEEADLFVERIGDVEHLLLNSRSLRRLADYGPFTVPPGELFVMGDNRDNSADSRVWGTVPRENVKGRAFGVWFSHDACKGNIPYLGELRTDRFFTGLR